MVDPGGQKKPVPCFLTLPVVLLRLGVEMTGFFSIGFSGSSSSCTTPQHNALRISGSSLTAETLPALYPFVVCTMELLLVFRK